MLLALPEGKRIILFGQCPNINARPPAMLVTLPIGFAKTKKVACVLCPHF